MQWNLERHRFRYRQDWLQEGDYQYSVEEDETVTLRNYIGTESVIVTPKEVGGKEVTRIGDSCFLRKTDLRAVQISEGIVEIRGICLCGRWSVQ